MPAPDEDLVAYICGRCRWASPQGVVSILGAARDFYQRETGKGTKAVSTREAEEMLRKQMGIS